MPKGLTPRLADLKQEIEGYARGFGLDCFETEPYSGPLKDLSNAVLTCHMGAAAEECRVRMEVEAAKNLLDGLRAKGELA